MSDEAPLSAPWRVAGLALLALLTLGVAFLWWRWGLVVALEAAISYCF